MNSEEIKKDNKLSFRKFIVIIIVSMLIGGFIGFFSAMAGDTAAPDKIAAALNRGFAACMPYGIPAAAVVLLTPAYVLYRRAKKMLAAWDGEDEAHAEHIDHTLNDSLFISSFLTPILFLFLSASIVYSDTLPGALFLVPGELLIAEMLLSMLTRRVIDQVRLMNPEKKGSFYDMKFQKKWLDSCDENERRQVGEASFFAYRTTLLACIILWAVLLFAGIIFHISILPTLVVTVTLTVLSSSYFIACRKEGRK